MASEFQQTHATTREFTLQFLEQITDNFSEEHIIGRGGYGIVYKGKLENGEMIALKKLHHMPGLDDTQFRNEFNHHMRTEHPNITRLVGYCFNQGHQRIKYNGEYIFANVEERVLCFEYLPGGSLDKHISAESCGLDWHTRFNIIRGICDGLNYLHNGSQNPIYHLDLKPANILLDEKMIPKIGDFGLSRLFPSAQTYITTKITGTRGYMPPEYIDRYKITSKFDVYSLGVIVIQIMAGYEGYSKFTDMSSQKFLKQVIENWDKQLQATMSSHTSEQVKTCIEIALRCVEVKREKRPTMAEIVDELNKFGTAESLPIGKVANFRSKHAFKENSNSDMCVSLRWNNLRSGLMGGSFSYRAIRSGDDGTGTGIRSGRDETGTGIRSGGDGIGTVIKSGGDGTGIRSGRGGDGIRRDNGGFPRRWVASLLGFLIFSSGMAVFGSRNDTSFTIFLGTSHLNLVLLFCCIWLFKRAAPGSPGRNWLKASIWTLTTLLTFSFGYMVLGTAGGFIVQVAVLVIMGYMIAAATAVAAFYAIVDDRNDQPLDHGSMLAVVPPV